MPAMEVAPVNPATKSPEQSGAGGGQRWFFAFFLVSGFCSILYELIWLRLAMAQFGVTTPMISIVLSSFMEDSASAPWPPEVSCAVMPTG